jgi:hypothetical protein
MVIDRNETRLKTMEQTEQFLAASANIEFTAAGSDAQRYAHISALLQRFDYPHQDKRGRGQWCNTTTPSKTDVIRQNIVGRVKTVWTVAKLQLTVLWFLLRRIWTAMDEKNRLRQAGWRRGRDSNPR